MLFSKSQAAALALSLPLAFAQTYTTCNPLEKTCPNNPGLTSKSFSSNFLDGKSAMTGWTPVQGTTMNFGSNGAEFTVSAAGQGPTIASNFYIFFGRISVKTQAAPGDGIVSSIVLLSDDLDEIDWEFLGGNTGQVETNFFGKGNTTAYDRATYESVSSPQTESHTYTIDWNSDRIEWIIDGTTVRTLESTDPLTVGGKNYPQSPMQLKIGNWCGGCAGNGEGTIQWAGGPPNFSQGPFTMYLESVEIENYNPASAYEWVGNSGSWQSIKIIKGNGQTGTASGAGAATSAATIAPAASSTAQPSGNNTHSHALTSSAPPLPSGASPTANTPTPSGAASASSASSSPSAPNAASELMALTSTSLVALFAAFLLL